MSSHPLGHVESKRKTAVVAAIALAGSTTAQGTSQDHGPPIEEQAQVGARSRLRLRAAMREEKRGDIGLVSARSMRSTRAVAAGSSSGTIVDMAKALVARKRTPARSRNITLRLTGNSLEFFEILEAQMCATPSDVFRDGLWIGLVAAERYVKRDKVSLVLQSGEDGIGSDILDRGFLNTVERFATLNRTWDSRKSAKVVGVRNSKADTVTPGG